MSHNTSLLLLTLVTVIGLILLIARFKLNAFVALTIASVVVGLGSGMEAAKIPGAFQEGVGAVLRTVAAVVGLGTILGKLLAESGGAEVIARTLIAALGQKRLHWAMFVIALLVGIPTWFTVGLVLLIPIVYTIARETKVSLLYLGIPLVAGLSVAHGLVPPHPGPLAAIGLLHADIGKTILYSLIVAVPTAMIGGPLFGRFIASRVPVELGGIAAQLTAKSERRNLPGFGITVFTILLPVGLMLLATGADVALKPDNQARVWLDFVGSPVVAMLIAVLVSFYTFGSDRGFDRAQVLKFTDECLGPVATVLLVVGAGGGFNNVLIASGVGDAFAEMAKNSKLSPLLLGWLIAALIRVATGSATVGITTAASFMAAALKETPGVSPELLIVAMGAGSLILSHVNDGGFWFVKEYLNMTVPQTLKTWTVLETLMSVVALLLVLFLKLVVS